MDTAELNQQVIGEWVLFALSDSPLENPREQDVPPFLVEFASGKRFRSYGVVDGQTSHDEGVYSIVGSNLTVEVKNQVMSKSWISLRGEYLLTVTEVPEFKSRTYSYFSRVNVPGNHGRERVISSVPNEFEIVPLQSFNPSSIEVDADIADVQKKIGELSYDLLSGWVALNEKNMGDADKKFMKKHEADVTTDWLLNEHWGDRSVISKTYRTTDGYCAYSSDFIIEVRRIGDARTRIKVRPVAPYIHIGNERKESGGNVIGKEILVRVHPTTIEEYSILLRIGSALKVRGMEPIKLPALNGGSVKVKYRTTDIVDLRVREKISVSPGFPRKLLLEMNSTRQP